MSADPDNEYFSDGLSESIINVLNQLNNFKVVARTSAFSFKGKDVNIREIGRELKQAIELNPGNALAHNYYSVYISVLGKHDKSIEEAHKALDLDPVSLTVIINLGMRYYYDYQFDKSLEYIQKAIDLDPNSFMGYCYSAYPLMLNGKYKEAIRATHKTSELLGERTPHILSALGLALALLGDRHKAEEVLEELIALSDKGTIPMFIIPWIYFALDERDKAFDWMKRASEENDPLLMWIKSDPIIKRLEPDQRYQAMLRKLGLDRY